MRLFRGRRARRPPGGAEAARCPDAGRPAAALELEGSYVTDGASLFRVANTIRDTRRGQLLLEIEDCRTLETTLCPADAVHSLDLETVVPARGPSP